MGLSEKLTALRKSKRLSQLELAEAIKVSRQAISRWEVGTAIPSAENLKCLSEFYEISIDELVDIAVGSMQEKGEKEPTTESIKDTDKIDEKSEECNKTEVPVEVGNPGDVFKCKSDKLFVVIVCIWICVLLLGIFRQAFYAATFFIIDTIVLFGAVYLLYNVSSFYRRKTKEDIGLHD